MVCVSESRIGSPVSFVLVDVIVSVDVTISVDLISDGLVVFGFSVFIVLS